MKMFKKLTSIVLIVAFVFTLIPLSAMAEGETEATTTETTAPTSIFADVNDGTKYKDAIEDLYNRKIVDGYLDEKGVRTFKPEATITRGEFAKLLAVALPSKITLNMNEKTTGFADIDTDASVAWTIPYVKAAVNASVVNGYPDGTFRAQNTVTYAEAVKMIVCAMGYANKVEVTEPWYNGYITIAEQLKIRMNANGSGDHNAPASRGLVAQLIINMATSKHIIANVVPGINDNTAGSDGMGNFIDPDEDKDDVEEDSGLMIAAFDYSLTDDVDDLSRTQVLIDDVVYEIGSSKTIDEMKNLVGYEVDFEYEVLRSKKTIIKISKTDVTEFEIPFEDILYTDDLVMYYEQDSKEKKIKFSLDTYFFYNGEPTGELSASEIEDILDIENGYIKIIDNGSNKSADVAFIYNYITFFVGGKDSSSNIVTDMYTGERIVLGVSGEDESDNVAYYLSDNAGKLSKAYFSTIAKNSVLSIARPYTLTEDSVTEVIISKRTVKGDVTKKGDDYFVITSNSKDAKYYTTAYYDELAASNPDKAIKVGGAGTYYLDYKGKIVSTAISDTLRYGYIVDVITDDNTDPIIRMVTSTNKNITEFTLNQNVTINGERGNSRKKVVEHLENSAEVINDGSGKYEAGYADSATYSQPIIFETTSSTGTIISSIKTVTEDNADGSLEYDLGRTIDGEKLTYYTSGYSFKRGSDRVFSMTFSSTSDYKAKIFVVPSDRADEDEYGVYTSSSYFKNGTQYVVDAFNVDPTNKYGNIIVVYGGSPVKIDGSNKSCIVTNIAPELNEDNERVKRLYYMELSTKDPVIKSVVAEDVSLVSGLNNGDIIKIATKNDAGEELVMVERIFVDEELYEAFDEDLDQEISEDYTFTEKYGTDTDYFNSVVGRIFSGDETNVQLIKGYEIEFGEDDPEIDDVYDSAVPYSVSGTATYVMVVNSTKINNVDDEGNNEGIKYYLYNAVTLNSITSNGLGIEDFVYAQRSGTGRITGLVIYR